MGWPTSPNKEFIGFLLSFKNLPRKHCLLLEAGALTSGILWQSPLLCATNYRTKFPNIPNRCRIPVSSQSAAAPFLHSLCLSVMKGATQTADWLICPCGIADEWWRGLLFSLTAGTIIGSKTVGSIACHAILLLAAPLCKQLAPNAFRISLFQKSNKNLFKKLKWILMWFFADLRTFPILWPIGAV